MGFANDLKLACESTEKEINSQVIKVATDLFRSIVNLTPSPTSEQAAPTATGLLINQWYPQEGGGFSSSLSSSTSTNGSASLSRISELSSSNEFLGKDGVVTLTNNVDHSYRAEYQGWPQPFWSGRSVAHAMVGRSITKILAENQ